MQKPEVRKGMPDTQIGKDEFGRRFRAHFYDPAFEKAEPELEKIIDIAWDAYDNSRKAPRTRKAGPGYADPDYDLSIEWIAASKAIAEAQTRHDDDAAASQILIVNASPRSEHTCPGEMSKSYRLAELAQRVVAQAGAEAEILDLSRLTAEYGKVIYPCKACVSTAMPLCHWPCSCYPNHSLNQTGDWMNEIYPKWVAAHGVMIITPVHWYQAPSALKLMIDRLVCADGGNPDPTSTHGKSPDEAKALELAGWPYPRHLAGRAYAIVVHGDTEGAGSLTHALTGWLSSIGLVSAGNKAVTESYVGYYEPYATSHESLDHDPDFKEEVLNAARALVTAVKQLRSGDWKPADSGLREPRPK
jgi:multimeric flavodoxin WrbA